MPKKFTSFGEHIRKLREEANLSLRQVATDLKIDPSLLGKFERNERNPSREFAKQISLYYEIKDNTLINEYLSDQIAYKILDEEESFEILKVAEAKAKYLKSEKNGKI